ncbi:MAG: hypothetical protein ACRDIE_19935, partial [Chloroflexota bacterium]
MALRAHLSRMGRSITTAWPAGLLIAGLAAPIAGHAAPGLARGFKAQDFIVVSVAGNVAPTTMMVERRPDSPEITIAINPTTALVRRYNGPTNPSQFSAGDHVRIMGASTTARTITATEVKDNNIQVAYT